MVQGLVRLTPFMHPKSILFRRGRFWRSLGRFGALFGAFWSLLGTIWGYFGWFWTTLGSILVNFAHFWYQFRSEIRFVGTSAAFGHRSGILSVILDQFSIEIKVSAPFSETINNLSKLWFGSLEMWWNAFSLTERSLKGSYSVYKRRALLPAPLIPTSPAPLRIAFLNCLWNYL